jgi:hypothetical protein
LPTLRTPIYPRDSLDQRHGNHLCGACGRRDVRNEGAMNLKARQQLRYRNAEGRR